MPATCFLRRASKNFSAHADRQQHEREYDDERDDDRDRHLVDLHHGLEHRGGQLMPHGFSRS